MVFATVPLASGTAPIKLAPFENGRLRQASGSYACGPRNIIWQAQSHSSSRGLRSSALGEADFIRQKAPSRSQGRRNKREKMPIQCSATDSASNSAPPPHTPFQAVIAGAPASGKGTQCEKIVKKYGLVHVSAGDILRAEVQAGTEYGKRVKGYMDAGQLVPDDVVVTLVKERLARKDAQEKGWLLDGYPRSMSQATALENAGIRPQVFILLEVPDSMLVDRVTGRRQDPETGKIYHLTFFPPESDEVATRLIQRSDDTEEKVKNRLAVYHEHLDDVVGMYSDIMHTVNGNQDKEAVFADIERTLESVAAKAQGKEDLTNGTAKGAFAKYTFPGIPTKLNSTPTPRKTRQVFYKDACYAVKRAVEAGVKRMEVRCTIPELNPEMDVYRVGTLMELLRELAFTFTDDGKRVKVCVQGAMGLGIFRGLPLQLAGTRRILEMMDWGEEEDVDNFIRIGAVGAEEVAADDDLFVIMAPQNAVANCIIDDLQAMVEAAGDRPIVIVNPRLKDVPSSAGVMQVIGRKERMDFTSTFFKCYHFRLLYNITTMYPILGAFRYSYPGPYEIYKRQDLDFGVEEYELVGTYEEEPTPQELNEAILGRRKRRTATSEQAKAPSWKFW